jgi:hypothetical protein
MKTLKILSILVLFTTKLFSQINMTTTSSHTQNFNTLATSGTTNAWTNNSTISSWYSQRSGTGTQYAASTGTATAGNLYSFGTGTNADRSLGTIGSGGATAGNFAHGVLLRNTSGNTITSITVSYTLEQWRNGNNTTPNVVTFWYKTSSSTISSLTPNTNTGWTQVSALNTQSPINTTSAGALDGNATANKSTLTNISIPSLSLVNNSYIMLKWEDPDHTGNDHGLGIDDVTISWTTAFTPTATITGAATTSVFTTTYGTESTAQSFSISGSNLTASITATAPTGFEVSNDGITYGSTTTFTQSSGSASGTLRIRLKSNASATGTYNSNNIVLSSSGASSVNITTPSSGNSVSTKALTISGISFNNKAYDGTTTTTITGTPSYVGLVNSESFSVSGSVTWAFSSVDVGSAISITRTGSYSAPSTNYTVTQPTGFTANIIKANQTITFNNLPFKCLSDVDFAPDAVSSVGLALTLTSSNTSIATIVSNKVHIVGNGTCTITASQAGNTNCFPATDVSKTLIVKSPTSRWSFEAVTVNNTGTTPNFGSTSQTADIGDLTTGSQLTGFHSSNSTWSCGVGGIVGNGSNKSLHVTNWSVGDYFQFQLSTTYYDSLLLTVEQTSSGSGPRDFKLQYSLNGTSYTDITTYQVPYYLPSLTVHSWSSTNYQSQSAFSFDLSLLSQIHNQSLVYFRLVNTSTTALLGGTIQTAGTSRIDNISLMGNYNAPLDLEGWIRNNPKPEYIPQAVIVSDCDEPSTYYDIIGRQVEKLQPGKIYIKKSCGQSERFMITE